MSKPTARELLNLWNLYGYDSYKLQPDVDPPSELIARIEKVLALHKPIDVPPCDCGCKRGARECDVCGEDYPCEIVRLLNGEDV